MSANSETYEQQVDRREFLAKAARVAGFAVGGAVALSIPGVAAAIAQDKRGDVPNTSNAELPIGISYPTMLYNDALIASSGVLDYRTFWAPSQASVRPEEKEKDNDPQLKESLYEQSLGYIASTGGPENVLISIPSVVAGYVATEGYAPEDYSRKGYLGRWLEHTVMKYIDTAALIVPNEPDKVWWKSRKTVFKHLVELIRLMDDICDDLNYEGLILTPASSDKVGLGTTFLTGFVENFNEEAKRKPFKREIGLAGHYYHGIKINDASGIRRSAKLALKMHSDNKKIYYPETGYILPTVKLETPDESEYNAQTIHRAFHLQQKHMLSTYDAAREINENDGAEEIGAFINYTFYDSQWSGGAFDSGLVGYDRLPHPIFDHLGKLWQRQLPEVLQSMQTKNALATPAPATPSTSTTSTSTTSTTTSTTETSTTN